MTIKAILRDGVIHPVEPLPGEWADGQELVVETSAAEPSHLSIDDWAKEIEEAAAKIPEEEHQRFQAALDEIKREGKESVRREWGLS